MLCKSYSGCDTCHTHNGLDTQQRMREHHYIHTKSGSLHQLTGVVWCVWCVGVVWCGCGVVTAGLALVMLERHMMRRKNSGKKGASRSRNMAASFITSAISLQQ